MIRQNKVCYLGANIMCYAFIQYYHSHYEQ